MAEIKYDIENLLCKDMENVASCHFVGLVLLSDALFNILKKKLEWVFIVQDMYVYLCVFVLTYY